MNDDFWRKRDAEIKILLGCTPEEANIALAVHQAGSQAALLVERQEIRST